MATHNIDHYYQYAYDIHEDIIGEICGWMDCIDLWFSCRGVNRTWNRVSLDDERWERFYRQRWYNLHFVPIHTNQNLAVEYGPPLSSPPSPNCWSYYYMDRRRHLLFSTANMNNGNSCYERIESNILSSVTFTGASTAVVSFQDDWIDFPLAMDTTTTMGSTSASGAHNHDSNDNQQTSGGTTGLFKSFFQRIGLTLPNSGSSNSTNSNHNNHKEQELQRRLSSQIMLLDCDEDTYGSLDALAKLATLCFKLLRLKSNSVEALYSLSKIYITVEQYSRALIYASECLQHLSIDMAHGQQQHEKLLTAAASAQQQQQPLAKIAKLHLIQGVASLKMGNYGAALSNLDLTLVLTKNTSNNSNNSSNSNNDRQQYTRHDALYYHMITCLKLNDMDMVYRDVKELEGVRLSRGRNLPYAKIGQWLFDRGQYSEAKTYLSMGESELNRTSIIKRMIVIAYHLQEYESVLSHMDRLHYYMAQENQPADIIKGLRSQFRKCVKESYRQLGVRCFARGDTKEALRNFCYAVITDVTCMKHPGCVDGMTARELRTLFADQFVKRHKLTLLAKRQYDERVTSPSKRQQQASSGLDTIAHSYYYLLYAMFCHWVSKVQQHGNQSPSDDHHSRQSSLEEREAGVASCSPVSNDITTTTTVNHDNLATFANRYLQKSFQQNALLQSQQFWC